MRRFSQWTCCIPHSSGITINLFIHLKAGKLQAKKSGHSLGKGDGYEECVPETRMKVILALDS
jgi:hypothetical protein